MLIKFEVKIELLIITFLSWNFDWGKQISYTVGCKCRLAKDSHDFDNGSIEFEVMFNDANKAVSDDCHMDLYSDCILRFTPESLDLKMLLDPLEEQLNLPSISIKQGNVRSLKIEVVRIVCKTPMKIWSIVDNASDNTWVFLLVLLLREADALVFKHIVFSIKKVFAINDFICRMSFLPDDKESSKGIDSVKAGEVKVPSVKDIARKRLIRKPIHGIDIMHLSIRDSIEYRYLCRDVNLSVNPDTRLCPTKLRPPENRHAEVDGSRVNGIEFSMQFKLFGNTFRLSDRHHVEGKLFKDTMISESVRFGKRLTVDWRFAESEKEGLFAMCNCYISKFPKAVTTDKLTKHKNQQVIPVRQAPFTCSVIISNNNSSELPLGKKLCYLRENESTYMHICSDLKPDAKLAISKPGQHIRSLKCCA